MHELTAYIESLPIIISALANTNTIAVTRSNLFIESIIEFTLYKRLTVWGSSKEELLGEAREMRANMDDEVKS